VVQAASARIQPSRQLINDATRSVPRLLRGEYSQTSLKRSC